MELVIPRASYLKMVRYARAVESEISGLADCTRNAQGNFRVGEVYLLKQEVSGAAVDLVEESVHKFLAEQIQKGITRMPRLWWHSHYNFKTFFSGTDEDTIQRLRTDTFIVAICVNQGGEMSAKAIISGRKERVIDPLPIRITPPLPSFTPTAEIIKEVAEKVETRKWPNFGKYWRGEAEDEQDPKKTETEGSVFWLPRNARKKRRFIKKHHLFSVYDLKLKESVYGDWDGNVYREHSTLTFGGRADD